MADLDLLGTDKWGIKFEDNENVSPEVDRMVNDFEVAKALKVAEKIINTPELYSKSRQELLDIITAVRWNSLRRATIAKASRSDVFGVEDVAGLCQGEQEVAQLENIIAEKRQSRHK